MLVYHRLVDPAGLREQIRYLVEQYRVVELDGLVGMIGDGRTLPPASAAVTFDDGLRSVFTVAFPVLCEFSCPATVFVNPGVVDTGAPIWPTVVRRLVLGTERPAVRIEARGETLVYATRTAAERESAARAVVLHCKTHWLGQIDTVVARIEEATGGCDTPYSDNDVPATWDRLLEMEASGLVRVGNHTLTHCILPGADDDTVRREILTADLAITQRMARPSRVFCYPNGDVDARAERILARANYSGAVTTVQVRASRRTRVMHVPRIGAHDFESLAEFRTRSSGALIPVRLAAELGQRIVRGLH